MTIDPEFSRKATQALQSPWWYRNPPPDLDDAKYAAWVRARNADHATLQQALAGAETEDDLEGKARDLYEHCLKELDDHANDTGLRERMGEEMTIVTPGDRPVREGREPDLNSEESAALAMAIIQATIDGDPKTAKALGEMAHDPATVRKILKGSDQ